MRVTAGRAWICERKSLSFDLSLLAGQRYDDTIEAEGEQRINMLTLQINAIQLLFQTSWFRPYPLIVSANAQLWFSNCSSSLISTPPSLVTTAIEYLSRLLASL